jgi:acyl-CoA hydrolase
MVEACFVAASKKNGRADNVVCINVQGLQFTKPVGNGDIVDIEAFVAYSGSTSLTVVGRIFTSRYPGVCILETAVTFVTLGGDGNPSPHGIAIERPEDPEMREYWDKFDRKRKKYRTKHIVEDE